MIGFAEGRPVWTYFLTREQRQRKKKEHKKERAQKFVVCDDNLVVAMP